MRIVRNISLRILLVLLVFALLFGAMSGSKLASSAGAVPTDERIILNDNASSENIVFASMKDRQDTSIPDILYGVPTAIYMPTVGISNSVIRGDIVNGEWVVSENAAHYATIMPLPNTFSGNTVIYAHNRPHLFQNTLYLRYGDPLFVLTEEGLKFRYVLTNDEIVRPDNTSVFNMDGPPQVTLITCHGPNDMFRRLIFFQLEGVEPMPGYQPKQYVTQRV